MFSLIEHPKTYIRLMVDDKGYYNVSHDLIQRIFPAEKISESLIPPGPHVLPEGGEMPDLEYTAEYMTTAQKLDQFCREAGLSWSSHPDAPVIRFVRSNID